MASTGNRKAILLDDVEHLEVREGLDQFIFGNSHCHLLQTFERINRIGNGPASGRGSAKLVFLRSEHACDLGVGFRQGSHELFDGCLHHAHQDRQSLLPVG